MRADEFLDQGILDGQRIWMRIMQTIENRGQACTIALISENTISRGA